MRTTDIPGFEASCQKLYRSYEILNRICWQGQLPASCLYLSCRMSNRTCAYAQNCGGSEKVRIVFNAGICRLLNRAELLQLMTHEMIHIYQFSQGRRGGHGRDFRSEQIRLGLIKDTVIQEKSPFGYVLFMHNLRQLDPDQAMRQLAGLNPPRKLFYDYFTGYRSGSNF